MASYLNDSSTPNKKIFFSVKSKKYTHLDFSSQRYFYVYSKQSKSNPNQGEKYPENTEVSQKKKYITVILLGDFNELEKQPTGNVLQNGGCSGNFKNIFRKTSVIVYIIFDFTNKSTPPRMFSMRFPRYFRTPQDGCF